MNFNKFLDRLNRDKIFKNRFEIYDSINRHIIISMYLIKRISCYFTNNIISIGINSHGNAISANCGPHLMSIESPFYAFKKKHRIECEKITDDKLKIIFQKLHMYFNPLCWRVDRIGSALGYFWDYLITSNQPNLAFLSLVSCIEALVSTGSGGEITHKICERVAVLLSDDRVRRIEIYKNLKKIYHLRSKFIHGSLRAPKGSLGWGVSAQTAKRSYVSLIEFAELIDICVQLFNKLLDNKQYLLCVDKKNEDNMLDEFFLTKLFS